jgi:hypothetical protein
MNHLNKRQVAAILCGLRLLEERLQGQSATDTLTPYQREILTNGGENDPLDTKQVAALRELINLRVAVTFTSQEISRLAEILHDGADVAEVLACGDSDDADEPKRLERIAKIGKHLGSKFEKIATGLHR